MPPPRNELCDIVPDLYKLQYSHCKGRHCALKKASKPLIRGLACCARAYLRGELDQGNRKHLQALKGAKQDLLYLCDKEIPTDSKRQLLVQQEGSGFLAPLIALGLPFLLNLLKS